MSTKLHYVLAGSRDKRPILFLHGFMGVADDWEACIDWLANEFFCIAVDLPGHGRSIDREPWLYSMEGCVRALIDVLDDLGLQQCGLLGYSMGGRVALYVASTHPERFDGVVLESASPGLWTAAERAARRQADEQRAQELEHGSFDTFLDRWYSQPLFKSFVSNEAALQRIMQRRRQNRPAELAKSLRGIGTGVQPSLWERLPGLQLRLLVVVGEQDEKFKRIGQSMVELNRTAQLMIVPNAGHNVHIERPNEYVRIIYTFFSGYKEIVHDDRQLDRGRDIY
jgi:2-succinyl-6-hydroxy-2,4-cyclohexadiene-1-carboxylate synthase